MRIQPDEPMGPGFFIFFQPVVDVRPPVTNAGGARYFTYDPDCDKIVTHCPIPEAEKHCRRAEDEFKLFKLHCKRIKELNELISELRSIPKFITKRQFIKRTSRKQEAQKELVKEIQLKNKSELILEQEEEAIIVLMFNERYNF